MGNFSVGLVARFLSGSAPVACRESLGVDLERNLGDPFSAINTRSGDVLRLNFKGITGDLGGCYVHLIGSAILEIREAGSFLFD